MFQAHEGSTNWEKLVTGDGAIVSSIQIAELPDCSTCPFLVQFRFNMRHLVVAELRVELFTIGEFLHDVEEPLAHSAWEINHLFIGARLKITLDS